MEADKLNQSPRTDKAGLMTVAGALISAVLASACCWLPLLLIAFGASGGALSARFEAMRPFLLPVTFIFLGLAFYFTYRKPKVARLPVAGGSCCASPDAGKAAPCCSSERAGGFTVRNLNKIILWTVAVFALGFAFFPSYVGFFLGRSGAASAHVDADSTEWAITIKGMTCEGCATHIESELRKIPGVVAAKVRYKQNEAVVEAGPAVSESDLRKAVEKAGYRVPSIRKLPRWKPNNEEVQT